MLKVTDTGVTIALQPQSTGSSVLTQLLWVGIAIAVIGTLMAINALSAMIGAVLILTVLIASAVWSMLTRNKTTSLLTGGELRLTQQGFSHHQDGKATHYQLSMTDSITATANGLSICNANGDTLYHIQGFHDPKHIQIAQAVLQGKPIKTQGKAIKLQSS